MSNGLQLPACQKCKLRKVRCDRQAPKCGNCTRANAACIILDPETGSQYTRGHIWQLENEERSLNQKLQQQYNPRSESGENPASPARNHAQPGTVEGRHSEQPDSQGNTPSRSYFVGHGSGLEFLQNILSDAKWQQHRAHILNQLAARPRLERQRLTPSPLPPLEEAELLLDNYFTHFHIHHAFVLRSDVFSIFYRLYSLATADNTVSNQDRFRLFMVFAISATTKHRSGLGLQDPYRYFKAAELFHGKITLIKDVDAIQNLLLVARFGMYHHINTSLWDISQLCMRQCVEWQLHLRSSEVLDPLAEQHRRRIFWVTYILDRYNSGILGRPFSIQDRDITVPLPLDVDDSTIINSNADSLDKVLPNTSSQPTELSVFIHCIKLRQISSRIHTDLYAGRSPASQPGNHGIGSPSSRFQSIGHLYTAFSQFRSELKLWHSTCPVFLSPKSLYEKAEWHDFLHEKDVMLLARGALHNIPPRLYSSGSVIQEIFVSCYESASRVIELYGNLMRKGAITWTRSYFQVIFTAGLTVIYCISQEVVKDWMGSRQPRGTLALCRDILGLFREKMPDAGSFTFVFEVLEAECIRSKINQEGETQCAERPSPYNITSQQPGANTTAANCIGAASHAILPASEQAHMNEFSMQPFGVEQGDTSLNVMGNLDLMIHLGTELDEYAWGWIPMDGNLWDGTSLYQV